MKELIKEETLDIVRQMITDGQVSQEVAEKYFPELKESEGERIRKALVKYYTSSITNPDYEIYGVPFKEVLAWLEKMKSNPYTGVGFKYNGQTWGMCARDGGVDILVDSKLISHIDIRQGEQKPTDKVEPKFKVGDKIYLKPEYRMPNDDTPIANTVFEIRAIDDKHYRFDSSYIFIEDQDKYELVEQKPAWTIQDAKDGDVLCCESGWTCIFKTLVNDETFSSYCFMDNTKWFCETGSECHTLNKEFMKVYNGEIKPATKEQRDLLFKKMHEAGYEWDAEHKQIKKIEGESAWSEEDKRKIDRIYSILRQAADTHAFSTSCRLIGDKECIELQDFLKSLRPQNII